MFVIALFTHVSISCSVGLVPSAGVYCVWQTALRWITATLWMFCEMQAHKRKFHWLFHITFADPIVTSFMYCTSLFPLKNHPNVPMTSWNWHKCDSWSLIVCCVIVIPLIRKIKTELYYLYISRKYSQNCDLIIHTFSVAVLESQMSGK